MDDFSFPRPAAAVQGAAPPFPPPWFLAAVAEAEAEHGGGGEEKMDMLWEDFNEELASAPPVCPLSPLHGGGLTTMAMMKDAAWLDSDSEGDVGGGGLAQTAGKRRRHYMVVRRRRWSLVLMLRLLKKLFLAKKSRSQRTAPL